MNFAVWAPLLVPLLAVPAARHLADALPPRFTAWLLAGSAAALAACSTVALALLAAAGALRLPFVAVLEHLSLPLIGEASAVTVPVACLAAVLLAAACVMVVSTVRDLLLETARAREEALSRPTAGDLSVVQDASPDAYALPGRPGRVVVTTGMLRALDPAEREALLAHERAHLAGRHHLFLAAVALAAACHPLLRGLRAPLSYALERWADESAASAVGDRRLAARAIGRAALATRATGLRPAGALAVAEGPVPRRVAALLSPAVAPTASRRLRLVAAFLFGCLVFSGTCAMEAAYDLHGAVEVSQGK